MKRNAKRAKPIKLTQTDTLALAAAMLGLSALARGEDWTPLPPEQADRAEHLMSVLTDAEIEAAIRDLDARIAG